MYKIVRNTHLMLGVMATPFLLIYVLSSLFFSHPILDLSRTKSQTSQLSLSSFSRDPQQLAQLLIDEYDMRGKLVESSTNEETNSMSLIIARPGKRYRIQANMEDSSVQVTENTANTAGFVNVLHKTAGIESMRFEENAWGFAILLLAIVLIALIVSGIWLWLLHSRERRAGIIFLGSSLIYGIGVLAVIRLG